MKYFFRFLFFLVISATVAQSSFAYAETSDDLLNLIEKKSFNFFWREANPANGLVRDKAFNFKAGGDGASSVASVGFALTAIPIGVERQWITRKEGYDRTLKTLKFFKNRVGQEHGFFYHFVDMQTGQRVGSSEVSSVDTALFLAGALFAGSYFHGTEVETLANEIYERVDFPWMLNRGVTLSMGWKPENKFLKQRWNTYNESMILYFLAIGSPTNPIPATSWKAITRKVQSFGPYILISSPPLFTHQYSHCWIDFRGMTDGNANYFKNSTAATLANRAFCLDQRDKYKTYSDDVWGLTACDGPSGYKAYGAEPGGAVHDGTVAPTAAISSIVFTPELSINAAKELYEKHKDLLWGRYGFCDSFNLELDWRSPYVIGIDQGSMLLMIENYRNGFVWKEFMKLPFVKKSLSEIGFHPGDETLKMPKMPLMRASKVSTLVRIEGNFSDWRTVPVTYLDSRRFIDYGEVDGPKDLSGEFTFQWDANSLYFFCRVRDDQVIVRHKNGEIHRDDLIELFINPGGEGFKWNDKKNFQFGFALNKESNELNSWLWPQGYNPVTKAQVQAAIRLSQDGYLLEAKIPWKLLGIVPVEGKTIRLSPAIHDVDANGGEGKVTWCFAAKNADTVDLGKVVLS